MRRSLPLLVLLLATAACLQRGRPEPTRLPPACRPDVTPCDQRRAAPRPRRAAADDAGRAASGPDVGADRRARRRLQLSLCLPARRAAHRRGAGAACPDVRAAHRRALPDHRHALSGRQRPRHRGDARASSSTRRSPAISAAPGVEAVVRAEGMLTESEISGTDVGTAIQAGRPQRSPSSNAELRADRGAARPARHLRRRARPARL